MSNEENKNDELNFNLGETDNFLMDLMIKSFDNQNERISNTDNKSYQLIAIIGLMFSLQATTLATIISSINIFVKIWFMISFVFYLVSIVCFIKSISFMDFEELPSQDALVDYYCKGKTKEEIISILLGNYQSSINNNEEKLNDKIFYSKKGFYFFIFGLLSTINFILLIVI